MKPDETEKSLEEGITELEHKLLEHSNSHADLVRATTSYLAAVLEKCEDMEPKKIARFVVTSSGLLLCALDRANDVITALSQVEE